MYEKAINLVLNFLKEHFPTIRLKNGFMWDLYVKAFSLLFGNEINELATQNSKLDLRNYATMAEADLDRVAANYFLSRQSGASATAIVEVEVSSALPVTIKQGITRVSTPDGYSFLATSNLSLSASQVASNPSGNYFSFKFSVYAVATGTEYNVGAGAISSLETSIGNNTVVSVTNPAPATSGANRETNTELFMRIVRSINTRGLLITRASVGTVILNNFPTVRAANVVGKGDSRMERDLLYPAMLPGGFSPYKRSDFRGKKAGVIRYNKNKAYKGRYTTNVAALIPSPSDLVLTEFTQDEYYSVIANDLEYMISRGGLEFSDDFDVSSSSISLNKIQDIENWIASDSGLPFGSRLFGSSVSILNGHLCLGATVDDVSSFMNVREASIV